MKHILTTFKKVALSIAVVAAASLSVVPSTLAETTQEALCRGAQGSGGVGECAGEGPTVMGTIGTITNILLYLAGAIAVIMIIIGGIRYVTSQGDQNSITSAKNTVLYAVIGLVVTIVAYAIVNFVIAAL